MISERPVVLCCPYLPLRKPVEFGGWWVGPHRAYEGPWLNEAFETRVRQLLNAFTTPGGAAIENPSLLARTTGGVNGEPPTLAEQRALEQAIAYATIDSNPWWTPGVESWIVATADNADLWVQPLSVPDGSIALGRGGRVLTTSGGHRVDDEDFRIPAPLELQLPFDISLDGQLLEAAFETMSRPPKGHEERSKRISVAMHWLTKSWLNSASVSESDRLVFLKTASEALTGETRDSRRAAKGLRSAFLGALKQEGEGIGVEELLWSPDEPQFARTWSNRDGAVKTAEMPAIEHWYMALADTRNDVVHALAAPNLTYDQPGSAYCGPLVEVGDRVLREAIAVELGACGHPEAWRRGFSRAGLQVWRRLRNEVC